MIDKEFNDNINTLSSNKFSIPEEETPPDII
jgi:hypothetical protein